MKDPLSFVLVLLIATISLNRGETVTLNNKRTAGLFAHPRIGRATRLAAFSRIDRASGLMAFPRNGRSELQSDYDVVLDFNYQDMSREMKRQGLIPFPRIGRSYGAPLSFANEETKRGDIVPNGGMWFGPRLGRLHRRSEENQSFDLQWALLSLQSDSSSTNQHMEKRRPETIAGYIVHMLTRNRFIVIMAM